MRKSIFLLVVAIFIFQTSICQNPLVTHMYTADPTARVFDGKLYVYPSHDIVPEKGKKAPAFCMPDYHMFSLENGSTWKDYGVILDQNEVPWGEKNSFGMWAPDCIKKGNKYYYYYPATPKDGSSFRRIGVGVSKKPTGPFKWEKNYIEGLDGIDPGLLLDDNGVAYLYYAGGDMIRVAKLKQNMKEIAAPTIKVEGLPGGYKEGPFAFKYKDMYYLTFAHVFPSEGYTIGYATSKSPLGPFEYRGKIMDCIDNGTNHHSIVKYQGKWILFYHWWHISGNNRLRSMCADYMTFKPDGTIKKVKPSLRGIGNPTLGDTIQIDRYNDIFAAKTTFVGGNEPKGWMISDTPMMSWVKFKGVDFGKGKAKKVQARISCGQRTGEIQLRLNNVKGKLIGKFPLEFTGGWNEWKTFETELLEEVTGLQDIVVVFKSSWGATKIANLNWLILTE